MVGDRGTDIAAGSTTILIDLGYTAVDLGLPDHKVASLRLATDVILAGS